jgi:hypothetical protein
MVFRGLSRYTKDMSGIRAQRKHMKLLSKEFYMHTKRVRALRYMFFYSQAVISHITREKMANKVWVSKVFKTWVQVLPELRQTKDMKRASQQFLSNSLKLKSLRALEAHAKRNIRDNKVVELFTDRRNTLIRTICLAAFFDSVCESKLKAQGFL